MPATQHDAVLWLSGSAYDVIFDVARAAIAALRDVATVADETSSWPYRHDLDLTGFVDGTENPTLFDAPELVLVPEGEPGAGGTVLLLQKWSHDVDAWEALPVAAQEQVIGRHQARQPRARRQARGLARRTAPTRSASATSSGATCRTGRSPTTGRCSSASPRRSGRSPTCSRAWPGSSNGKRDALTRFTTPLTGAYYFVPSNDALHRVAGDEEEL